jgi:hypothetical protein
MDTIEWYLRFAFVRAPSNNTAPAQLGEQYSALRVELWTNELCGLVS